mgnify:CR=1 FL=1
MPSLADLRAGDVVACYGTDLVSRCITYLTAWPLAPRGLRLAPSHVAVIVPWDGHNRLAWAESTTLTGHTCLARGERVKGWQVACHRRWACVTHQHTGASASKPGGSGRTDA